VGRGARFGVRHMTRFAVGHGRFPVVQDHPKGPIQDPVGRQLKFRCCLSQFQRYTCISISGLGGHIATSGCSSSQSFGDTLLELVLEKTFVFFTCGAFYLQAQYVCVTSSSAVPEKPRALRVIEYLLSHSRLFEMTLLSTGHV